MENLLKIHLLGGLSLTLGEQPLAGFVSAKAQALLCYLVLSPQPSHLRASLAALLWGEMSDEDAATNLRQVLANLRKLLEPYFIIDRQTVAFSRSAPYWLDVEAFLAGDTALYVGDLLAGFNVRDAEAFEEWLLLEREHLRTKALDQWREQATRLQKAGDAAGALAALRRLVSLDPLHEGAQRDLIWMLALNGQRTAALAQYAWCQRALAEQLGVAPERATTRLYERIRDAEHNSILPPQPAPLIGREAELAEVVRLVHHPQVRVICLVGMGGIGKTRLALEAAHATEKHMLHGAYAVFLTAITTINALYAAVSETFGGFSGSADLRVALLHYLRDKHLLLVLDNVEQIIEPAAQFVSEVSAAAPDVKILVTSRERLNISSEWLVSLEGLPCYGEDGSPERSPSAQLFWQITQRVRGDSTAGASEQAAAGHIGVMTGGMPLAIELAASWMRLLSAEQVARQIQTSLGFLEASTRDVAARHRSLRAVFDHSWVLLTEHERDVLRRLSVFRGGFGKDAAESIAGLTLPLLYGLVDKSMVRRAGEERWDLHEMTREYCAEQLAASQIQAATQQAHTRYFVAFAAKQASAIQSSQQHAAVRDFGADFENIYRAYGQLLTAHAPLDDIETLMRAFNLYCDERALPLQSESIFRETLPYLAGHSERLAAHCAVFQAGALERLGRNDEAKATAERALETLLRLGMGDETDGAHAVLGSIAATQMRLEDARTHYRDALSLRQSKGDVWWIGHSLLNLASVEFRAGDFERSRHYTDGALAFARQIGDHWFMTRCKTALAILLSETGQIDQARTLHAENLRSFEEIGNPQGMIEAYNGLGVVDYQSGDFAHAIGWFEQSMHLAKLRGDLRSVAICLSNLGACHYDLKDFDQARTTLEEAALAWEDLGTAQNAAMMRQQIADLDAELAAKTDL